MRLNSSGLRTSPPTVFVCLLAGFCAGAANLAASEELAGQAPRDREEASLPQAAARLSTGQPLRVVCFGDSVTGVYYHTGGRRAYPRMLQLALEQLYPKGLSQDHPDAGDVRGDLRPEQGLRIGNKSDVSVINAGISGNTTRDALRSIEHDVLRHEPHLVTVMFALNDMVRVPLDEFRGNLARIIGSCRQVGAEILLCTPNSVISTAGRPTEKLIQYCDAIRRVGREQDVPVCDCYGSFESLRGNDPLAWRLLMSDAIHPNMDGHKRLATAIAHSITGRQATLDGIGPPQPAIPKSLTRLRSGQPIRVLAMPPYDRLVGPAMTRVDASAQVEVTAWPTAGQSLAQIESAAKQVRGRDVDLVVVAVPLSASAKTTEEFISAFAWTLNWSLSFAHQQWDVIAVGPSAEADDSTPGQRQRAQLMRRLIRAQDLTMLDHRGGGEPAVEQLAEWLRSQLDGQAKD